MYETIKPDFIFEDGRGTLIQLVHDGYKQVNVIKTKAGVSRGGHYHEYSTEAFYVLQGSIEVTFKTKEKTQKMRFSAGDFFKIKPKVVHSMYYLEDCIMVGLYDIPIEKNNGEGKDIHTVGQAN